ncbi:MAG: hypothetical protein P8K68_02385 [Algibacter sp.]|uniref:hypothetical protein n=1 Tax=Algibacter sp. TaxID=1872428 RepID=UPI002629D77A|nr:hypothetical protein [Algibacter sp.]MDG1730667.1 hypothetical protein [Algibacter sp.]MDG2177618.1 hypothetical protein [Algibacter sp.]
MLKKVLFFILCLCGLIATAQQKDSLSFKNGIEKPSILSTHHFGIFSSRINTNFKYKPSKKTTLDFNYTSGNNFHPFVEAYYPKDPAVRKQLNQIKWHDRPFTFIDQENTPADYMNIVIDAVIKEFRVTANITINKQHELSITMRNYLITRGKHPFSLFTSDEGIEWFHSNIAGGEDPFGRRYYGLNQVNFRYQDRNGNTLNLNNNAFFTGGLEVSHYYYPKLSINKTRNIYLNFGTHLGWNTSRFNASIDAGISANAIKKVSLKNNYELNFAFGANLLHKNLINFRDVIDLGNNRYLGTLEGEIEITKYTKKGNFNAFGINYQVQSRYNKKEEAGYFKLLGKWREINGGWQNGVYSLYEPQVNWNFIYTYGTPKFLLSIFAKQDFLVNNAPDFQTGINLKIPIKK